MIELPKQIAAIDRNGLGKQGLLVNSVFVKRLPWRWLLAGLIALLVAACDDNSNSEPPATRTPVPTWTATPDPASVIPTDTPTTAPTATLVPEQPTEAPTATPDAGVENSPAAEDATPTETVVAVATTAFAFDLETAEKFPTESLAPNMVRVYLYVSDQAEMALGGYRLLVLHENKQLAVDSITDEGLPTVTRNTPGPYSRFTNMNAVFVETQSGRWTVQLLDPDGTAVGPPATFDLTADEATRELYVRYRMK